MKKKQQLIKEHLAHGVQLHYTTHGTHPAEYRCTSCGLRICGATHADITRWQEAGASVKPALPHRSHLTLVHSKEAKA